MNSALIYGQLIHEVEMHFSYACDAAIATAFTPKCKSNSDPVPLSSASIRSHGASPQTIGGVHPWLCVIHQVYAESPVPPLAPVKMRPVLRFRRASRQ